MRPPHVTQAIAFSPARLAGAAVLLGVVVLLAIVVAWRRSRAAGLAADEPLKRLTGFHIFGPDDEDDEPVVHVPVLRARSMASVPAPAPMPALGRIPPPPSAPGNGARAAVAKTGMPAPRRPGPTGHRAGTAAARQPQKTSPARAALGPPPPVPRPPAKHSASAQPAKQPQRTSSARATAGPPPQVPHPPGKPARAAAPWNTPRPATAHIDPNPAPPPPRPSRRPAHERHEDLPLPGDILLVEDDVTIATMYQMLLGTRGYTSRHAQDGVEGIAMVRQERPALILLDMMMPRMDGLQFLEALRGWPKTKAIPVVVLSNVGDRHLVDRALALGAVEYLVKAQTRPQVLIGALPHWLRGNRALTTLS